jgi:hypothetical protein
MKSKKFWIVVAVVGVMAIAAIVGVVVGVSTHQEATLLKVCWSGTGTASYGATCTEDLTWPRVQIPIGIEVVATQEGELRDEEMAGVLERVVADTNAQFGFEVFELSTNPDVEVHAVAYEGNEPERMHHNRDDNGRLMAWINIHAGMDVATLFAVLQHELGHVIGLAHDDFESSVMFPLIPGGELPTTLRRRFTDTDVAAIRARYAH